MRSWLSVLITDAESKKVFDIPIAPSLYSLSNKMDNSLLAVRDINHKYIVVEKKKLLRYSMQLSMLRQLLSMKLINDFEYEKIKKRLMRDYGVVSNITT